jgi:hypothetical protein
MTLRLPRLARLDAPDAAGALAVSGCGRGGAHHSPARRTGAGRPGRRLALRRPAGAGEADQEFMRARQADRWPGRDHHAGGTV